MFHPRAPQSLALLLGVLVFLVTRSHSLSTQQATQQIINNDFSAAQLALSLVINQMAVLRILNESSTISSLRERELQEMQNLKLVVEVKTEELKNDLQDIKEEALNELQTMKAEALNEINMKNEEATQGLHDLKETALNVSLQGERELQEMQNLKLVLEVKTEELKNDLQDFKEEAFNELQNMKAEALNEINMKNEEATQGLHDLKETTLNALQQGTTRRKTYRKYDIPITQSKAVEACEQLGGRLALITNEEDEEQVRKVIGVGFSGDKWSVSYCISGTDQQEERNWIDNVTGEPLHYTNFIPGQPDDAHGGEDCIVKSPAYLGWNDRSCSMEATGYVCEFIKE